MQILFARREQPVPGRRIYGIALSLLLILSDAGLSASWAKRIRPSEDVPDPQTEGVAVGHFQAYFRKDRSWGFNSIIFQKEGTRDYYKRVFVDADIEGANEPGIAAFHLPAGTYFIAEWDPGDLIMMWYTLKSSQADGRHPPLTAFEVKPGQAVYFGNIVGRWHRLSEGQKEITVEDKFEEARQLVEQKYPGWGEKLQKQLLTVTENKRNWSPE